MLALMQIEHLLPQLPALNINIKDINVDIEPSEFFLLPSIHIDAKIEIHFLW